MIEKWNVTMTAPFMIGGSPVRSGRSFPVIDPATATAFANCSWAQSNNLDAAVHAARQAFPVWASIGLEARAAHLDVIAGLIETHKDELALLLSREQGKPAHSAAIGEIAASVSWTKATALLRPSIDLVKDDHTALVEVHRRPLGVVGSITPWNHPVMIAVWHIMPALLAGNSVVIKPSAYTPLTTLRLVEIINGVLPPGVLNSVTGDVDIGSAMSRHPGIDKIVFTGSTRTGRRIMADAAETLKRLTLELGGNDAAIVLEDADIDAIAPKIFAKSFGNSGQTCAALKRLYVHDSLHDKLAYRLAELAHGAVVGPGNDPRSEFGPIQNKAQFDYVCGLARDAEARGATFLAGGRPLDGPGYFFPLPVVTRLEEGARLVDEEQFGPILPLIRFRDAEDALARANASNNGLGGSIWSRDLDRAGALAARLQTGTAWINDHATISPDAPFGGSKQSGLGVEFGLYGLDEFLQLQTVRLAR